jgi:hypothetical protein
MSPNAGPTAQAAKGIFMWSFCPHCEFKSSVEPMDAEVGYYGVFAFLISADLGTLFREIPGADLLRGCVRTPGSIVHPLSAPRFPPLLHQGILFWPDCLGVSLGFTLSSWPFEYRRRFTWWMEQPLLLVFILLATTSLIFLAGYHNIIDLVIIILLTWLP